MIFDDSVNKNKALLKKCADVCDGINNEVKSINSGEKIACDKHFVRIKFNSDDDSPWNKPLTFHAMAIIIISVFEEGGNLYLQVFLDDTLYEL